jgi:hypothetical protein
VADFIPESVAGLLRNHHTAVAGQVGSVFQAAGIALPPNLHERAA